MLHNENIYISVIHCYDEENLIRKQSFEPGAKINEKSFQQIFTLKMLREQHQTTESGYSDRTLHPTTAQPPPPPVSSFQ